MTRSISASTRLAAAALLVSLAACQSGDGAAADSSAAAPTVAPAADTAAPAAAATTTSGALLDPDAATREQLLTIPGMADHSVDALITGRPYADMLAVDRVLATHVTSEAARDSVYTRLWKPIDLNKASKEEILLIPGVGPRMQHEFEEYRPYQNIERFRREIGKYVDSTEVARLERYVTIR
jgi:DNA uptake protein ComE-like DNA-binding protein